MVSDPRDDLTGKYVRVRQGGSIVEIVGPSARSAISIDAVDIKTGKGIQLTADYARHNLIRKP